MKKIKILFWLIVIALLALIMYQNQNFLFAEHNLRINLGFYANQTPPVPSIIIFCSFFMVGLLLAYFSTLSGRFKSHRTIKELKQKIALYKEKNVALEKQVQNAKSEVQATAETPSETRDTAADTTQVGPDQP